MCVRHVLRKGVPVTTEDGEETLETDELIVKVENPFFEPMISNLAPYGSQMFDAYVDQLLNGTKNDFDYDYHTRLYQYKWYSDWGCEFEVDQVDAMIKKLIKQQNTRRAVAITWIPEEDNDRKDCPCLQYIQFLIRDGKLQMKVLFRSNDILLAMHANMYALVHLQKYVADQLGLPVGSHTHMVTVPHIYVKRDASELKKWV